MAKISYTPREAADEVGLSEDTVRAAIRAGDLRTARIVVNGRAIRKQIILHDDLISWVMDVTPYDSSGDGHTARRH